MAVRPLLRTTVAPGTGVVRSSRAPTASTGRWLVAWPTAVSRQHSPPLRDPLEALSCELQADVPLAFGELASLDRPHEGRESRRGEREDGRGCT